MSDNVSQLEYATMADLIDEISRRTRVHLVVCETDVKGKPGQVEHDIWYGGGVMAADGLARYAKQSMDRTVGDIVDEEFEVASEDEI